jgi:hypothetical protein
MPPAQPATRPRQARDADVENDRRWLYRVGGVAALLMVLATVLHSGAFLAVGLPDDVVEWFALFASNPLGGLAAFEILMVVYVLLSVPVALALFVALRRTSPSLAVIFVALSLIAVVAFIVARPAFEMLYLSDGYTAAASDAQRSAYLAAGTATLAVFHGTAFYASYILGSVSGLILSAAILRTTVFSKRTAYLRIASSVLDFGLFVPTIGLGIAFGSVVCLVAFNILVARRLLQLGRGEPDAARSPALMRSMPISG